MPVTKGRRVLAILDHDLHPAGDEKGLFLKLGGMVSGVELVFDWRGVDLPRSIILTPLAVAALIDAVEDDVVNTVRLGEALREMSQDPSLAMFDQIRPFTMTTVMTT